MRRHLHVSLLELRTVEVELTVPQHHVSKQRTGAQHINVF